MSVIDVQALPAFGAVVIGRNEGDRLRRCLESMIDTAESVVYVDSGSQDGSVELAHRLGVEVVRLDLSDPFTAARARNVGFRRLMAMAPHLQFAQFVDGDCEVAKGWSEVGQRFLVANPGVAVVCGRRRERFPERSVYNLLCDIEWDTPIGEARSCGGDAMMRADAFVGAGGFRDDLIAGEEPELSVRLREAGWKIWRLDAEMTLHDAAIFSFGQWWRRSVRAGHAFAEGSFLHGKPPERHWVAESRRGKLWGGGVPLLCLVLVALFGVWGFLVLALYPVQVIRLATKSDRKRPVNWQHAFFLVLGKFPELQGQMQFYWRMLTGGQKRLIEYK